MASLAPYLCPLGHLECSLAWGPSLLFGVSGPQKTLLAGVLLSRPAHQTLWGHPERGPSLQLSASVIQRITLDGVLPVAECVGCLMGQPLYCSAVAGVWGQRGYGGCSNPYTSSAASPCFHGYLAFHHRHLPPQSPLSHPLDSSLQSQQQPLPWDCSTIPKLQLPAAAPSR